MNMSNEEMARMHSLYLVDRLNNILKSEDQKNVAIYLNTGIRIGISKWTDGIFSASVDGLGVEQYQSEFAKHVRIEVRDEDTIAIQFIGKGFVEFHAKEIETII